MKKDREPLAIIGIGCSFPGDVSTPEEFWDLIVNGGDGLSDIPSDRWNTDAKYAPDFKTSGKISVKRGGFIKDIDKFDASFFGISPLEASRMDPQQRMLLELSYRAIEDAGLTFKDLDGSQTSVFVGISSHDYGDIQNSPLEQINIGSHYGFEATDWQFKGFTREGNYTGTLTYQNKDTVIREMK